MDNAQKTGFRWRVNRWFIVGFLVAFAVFGFNVRLMHFNGRGLFQIDAWTYYAIAFRKLFFASALGSGSVSVLDLLLVGTMHLAVSMAGGAVVMGLVWFGRKLLRRS